MEKPLPGVNLTRIEAQERKALVSVQSYDVTLDLTTGPETFGSTTTVRFTATPGASSSGCDENHDGCCARTFVTKTTLSHDASEPPHL